MEYGSGFIDEQLTVDFGSDYGVEYTSEVSGLTQTASPVNINLAGFLNTYLPACDCENCTLDAEGNCLIGVNLTTAATQGKAILANLQIGICQMKAQTCTFNQTTGVAGLCYDETIDGDLDCMATCTNLGTGDDPTCPNSNQDYCCDVNRIDSLGICEQSEDFCDSACGSEGSDCCAGNTCPTSGTCMCVAGQNTPQCRDPSTNRYKLFNISAINKNNTAYYTYENSTGQINTCCLSADNSTCRGWLGIDAS